MDELVEKANAALEVVLSIVPEEDLDKGREIVEILRSASPGFTADDKEAAEAEAKAIRALNGLI